jgi:putative tryptophan/tyrosine transport system ATP-binding protein
MLFCRKRRYVPLGSERGYRVELENVIVSSPLGESPILSIENLTISPGQFVAVIGSNASGKSTLLKAISGEIETEGSVKIAGQPITAPVSQNIDAVGIVHQNEELDLIDDLSIEQNISIRQILSCGHPNYLFSTSRSWRGSVIETLANRAPEFCERIDKLVGYLAGGKKQMLSVVLALYLEHQNNPCRLLLLDEHTARLDYNNAEEVMDYTYRQIKDVSMTAMMVTHRLNDAVKYCSRIIIIRKGMIVRDLPDKEYSDINGLTPDILKGMIRGK